MNLLIADTRKDIGRGHQSRIQALHHALGGHIVEMDDSVPCGIRLDGELICQGLEYALIRPEVVALRPATWDTGFEGRILRSDVVTYPKDAGPLWLERLAKAHIYVGPCGVSALEACCLGVTALTFCCVEENQKAQRYAIDQLRHNWERFQVIDGKGADRVAEAIREATQ